MSQHRSVSVRVASGPISLVGESPSHRFPAMFAPLQVAGRVLRNRVVMGSMHTRLENEPDSLERQQAFYAERARGGVAMIVTGGFAPNAAGRVEEDAPVLESSEQAEALAPLVSSVHEHGSLMLCQILHAGRYANHAAPVGASTLKSPIHRVAPRELTSSEVESTIDDFVNCAVMARHAGFDGVEIMGSEGYLINQFVAPRTNLRTDAWGGDAPRRMRLPVEIVLRIRAAVGASFIVMYRISAADLVEGGSTLEETLELARRIEAAGADLLNTGVGWHEARIPTVAYFVPRAAWRGYAARIKAAVRIPLMASNRINIPEVIEKILGDGDADLVSMARPFLADPFFVQKAADGREDQINTCIACNQACLDFIFAERTATCLVNPRAAREVEFDGLAARTASPKRVAIVGAGAAGMACAVQAAERGHAVVIFEAAPRVGGQLNYASEVPGKQEFRELIRYFKRRMEVLGVEVRLNTRAGLNDLVAGRFDDIVVATGVRPRIPKIPGIAGPNVITYAQLLSGERHAGQRVAIVGAGGVGFDVAAFLLKDASLPAAQSTQQFMAEWNVDATGESAGALLTGPVPPVADRTVFLLQRSTARFGRTLGLSTGWALRSELQRVGLRAVGGCEYVLVDDAGMVLRVEGAPLRLDLDTIVICAGQESVRELHEELAAVVPGNIHVVGGAERAGELDALRAIEQGTRLALAI